MDDVIAERELDLLTEGADAPSRIVVRIGRPRPDGQDWRTPYEIRGPGSEESRGCSVFGVDSMQSLLLALRAVGAELSALGRRGRLTFLGEADVGLPMSPGA